MPLTFVPGDPARTGWFAEWGGDEDGDVTIEVVLPAGKSLRRFTIPARTRTVADALARLVAQPPADDLDPTVAAWSAALKLGAALVARGRLLPGVTPDGWDTWRVGPLDAADVAQLRALTAAFPPQAHALLVAGSKPMRIRSAESTIRAAWDAVADVLVRTPAASFVGGAAFASATPVDVSSLRPWLDDAEAGLEGGAAVVLRLDLPEEADGDFGAIVQLRSRTDPSLIVDAADLWAAPAAVLGRLGQAAEVDFLVGLRRGARVWPPLGRVLATARPERLVLDDEEVGDLLGPAVDDLAGAGVEVLWPAEFAGAGRVQLRAIVGTPAPKSAAKPVMKLEDLLEVHWELASGGDALTKAELDALAEAKRPLVRLRGKWVSADPELLARLRRRTRTPISAIDALAAALTGQLLVAGEQVEARPAGPLAELAERLRTSTTGERSRPEPRGFTGTLREYQKVALAWLVEQCDLGLGGCLAMDMGTGKTPVAIALHLDRTKSAHLRGESCGPMLIVCPASLLGNWQRELAKFAPVLPVRRYHGDDRSLEALAPDEVVLVTYGVVRRDAETLATVAWDLVVADEAQHVKNPLSRGAKSLRTIPATNRIALTGTPVENRLSELWAILDWTTPGLLGPLETFRRTVAVPIERYRDEDATQHLAKLVRPFLFRRRKTDPGVAPELPPKTETDQVVPLTSEQITLYEAVVREALAEIENSKGIARRGLVLKLLTALKQVCNHPAHYLKQAGPLAGRSGKLEALDELLDVIRAEGESTLVFTQYVAMARLLERHLAEAGITTEFLHGGVPPLRRDEMVERFQRGEADAFLLSLKAGGVGLNLTQATHVIHFDRWWNPAVEDQATDRAYRIGQDKPVQVHRLITEGTVEDRIAMLIESKRELADSIVGTGEAWVSELSNAELRDLVALR